MDNLIESLASLPGVKRIAVENFLGSLSPDESLSDALKNLCLDARSYKWNAATVKAITQGIEEILG
jgi:hypothetical protein